MLVHTNKQLVCGQLYLEWHIPKWCATSCKYGKILTILILALCVANGFHLVPHCYNMQHVAQAIKRRVCKFYIQRGATSAKSGSREASPFTDVSFTIGFPPPAVNPVGTKIHGWCPQRTKTTLSSEEKTYFHCFYFMKSDVGSLAL